MKNLIHPLVNWVRSWDVMAILYSLIAATIFASVLQWLGGFRRLYRAYRSAKGLRSYRKAVTEACSSLIVIGRRRGFNLNEVFVSLDLAPSDLAAHSEESSRPRGSYVLVGGPGAGKSTTVKKGILENLRLDSKSVPFLIRLREYGDSKSIEEYIVDQFRDHKIPNPEILARKFLKTRSCLCVLDGLDEVRPSIRESVCNQINKFYQTFFSSPDSGQLIVTCRKEAYRSLPLDLTSIWEVRPLTDEQIQRFAAKWPLGYPVGKSADTFWRDLSLTLRVLELVRSPLLMVGGLMQYTESNLGIPEERVEYLARVAKWLVTDWAMAQGHPPDPYRTAYSRILARLALEIHRSQRSECRSDEAVSLIESWLPSYGHSPQEAKTVLDSIMTKTGILVRDLPSTVVFAQFGLQEYYASIDALNQLGIDQLVKVSPKSWWREVILLAIAQEKEPTSCLEKLFAEDPLLASSAVAEYPIPALMLQEKAVAACIDGVDRGDAASRNSAVALLRKIRGSQEAFLVSALEDRLVGGKPEISSTVGLILATAGTASATDALARHPAIWDSCLEAAGYLSSSFEKLLIEWIKSGDQKQSEHAIDLLAPRLSSDRFDELLALLPTLAAAKAHYAAKVLLVFIHRQSRPFGVDVAVFDRLSQCVFYVHDREYVLNEIENSRKREVADSPIAVALFLSEGRNSITAKQINQYLVDSIRFTIQNRGLFCYTASGLVLMAQLPPRLEAHAVLVLSFLLFSLGVSRSLFEIPWQEHRYRFHTPAYLLPLVGVGLGIGLMLTFGGRPSLEYPLSLPGLIAMSISYALTGIILNAGPHFYFLPEPVQRFVPGLWLFFLILALGFSLVRTQVNSVFVSGLVFLFWSVWTFGRLYLHWSVVNSAQNKVDERRSVMRRENVLSEEQ